MLEIKIYSALDMCTVRYPDSWIQCQTVDGLLSTVVRRQVLAMKKNCQFSLPHLLKSMQNSQRSAAQGLVHQMCQQKNWLSKENETFKEEKAALENQLSILMDTINDLSCNKKELAVKVEENDILKRQICQLTEEVHAQNMQSVSVG